MQKKFFSHPRKNSQILTTYFQMADKGDAGINYDYTLPLGVSSFFPLGVSSSMHVIRGAGK